MNELHCEVEPGVLVNELQWLPKVLKMMPVHLLESTTVVPF